MSIDWEEINSKLPFERSEAAKAKRKALFRSFDPNGNGYLSLAEVSVMIIKLDSVSGLLSQVDKGIRDVLACEELFDCKPAVNRAFHFAKNKSQGDDKYGPDYLEFREFRLFLQSLRQYFEYYQAFDRSVQERCISSFQSS